MNPFTPQPFDPLAEDFHQRLAVGLVHKLNNVISVMTGHCGLLLMDDELPNEIRNSIESISSASDLVVNYLNHFSSIIKYKASKMERMHLVPSLKKLATIHHFDFKSDRTDVSDVHADPELVTEILAELSANARRAAASSLRCHLETQDDFCFIVFNDNGEGIRTEIVPRIFDPFFTTHKTSNHLGLGLFMVQLWTQKMKGKLTVQSDGKTYTTVRIGLPIHKTA
jgi:two-component system, NtrC family, sensor kinase